MISPMSLNPSQIKSQVILVRTGATCMIVIFTLTTLAFGALAYIDYSRGNDSFNWTPIEAEITESYVDKDDDIGIAKYRPIITYKYTVDGQIYTSYNMQYGESGSYEENREPADTLVSQYPEGAIITVFYKPDEPYRSVIIQGPTPTPLRMMIGMAIAEIITSGSMVILSRKTKQQHKRLLADPTLGTETKDPTITVDQRHHQGYSNRNDDSS